MNLIEFLSRGIRLEQTVSLCYETLARAVPNETARDWLDRIAREETQHANHLRLGRDYALKMPGLLDAPRVRAEEIAAAMDEAEALLKDILAGGDRRRQLERLKALEEAYEKFHIETSVDFRDASLQRLFQDLGRDDGKHAESVGVILGLI